MAKTIEVKGVAGQCPVCQHPPIRHIQDGTGYTCVACLFVAGEAVKDAAEGRSTRVPPPVCTLKFEFKLSRHEREQAMVADKESYPPMTVCAACDCEWRTHQGYLCPTGDSTFIPVLNKDLPFVHVN